MLAAMSFVCAVLAFQEGIHFLAAVFALVALLLLYDTVRYWDDKDLK